MGSVIPGSLERGWPSAFSEAEEMASVQGYEEAGC